MVRAFFDRLFAYYSHVVGRTEPPDPQEFSLLLNDYEALDSDFWKSLSMQPHDWNFASGNVGGGVGVGGEGNVLGWGFGEGDV